MRRAVGTLRLFRGRLHARAYELHSRGQSQAAQAVWAIVEELDELLNLLSKRRR